MSVEREVRLAETDEELWQFLDHASVGLRWVDPRGHILWANKAELGLVGYSEREYVGQHISRFFVQPETADDFLSRLLREEYVGPRETLVRAKDGSVKHVLVDASALFRHGVLVHSRWSMRDITSLIEREQAARHRAEATSQLKDEFLALLSHELRSPLGAIMVWLGLLRQGTLDASERGRALDIIERGSRTLERIIEDLLHASRIAAGGLMLHPQLVDFGGVLAVALDAAAGDAGIKGLHLVRTLGDVPIWVRGDPGRLQQVVSNLLANAIKFTPAGGHIEVSLDVLDQQARLRVTDSGEGMSPEFVPHAFERFRQQDSSSTRAHHGLGLGLYVVRHVVGHHGGFVSAESPGPGRGSTFTLLLPLAADEGRAAHPTREGSADRDRAPDGLRVLLVDDEQDVREALAIILEQNGMVVTTAATAREGFSLLERLQPDVLLSDIAMPGEDGLTLIRRVRLLPPERGGLIPAASLSAYAGAAERRSALLAGFQHHLAKPVEPAHLLAVIARLARGKAQPDA